MVKNAIADANADANANANANANTIASDNTNAIIKSPDNNLIKKYIDVFQGKTFSGNVCDILNIERTKFFKVISYPLNGTFNLKNNNDFEHISKLEYSGFDTIVLQSDSNIVNFFFVISVLNPVKITSHKFHTKLVNSFANMQYIDSKIAIYKKSITFIE
jgi:hypothetical protein